MGHFHLVFTVPQSLRPFFLRKGRAHALEALFAASSETILEVALRDGLRLGVLAVLHTWNQLLDPHPHTHCLVPGPGGGFDESGAFVVLRRFLYSYKRLRHVFKIKLLQKLRALVKEEALSVCVASANQLLKDADSREWNVKVKRALAGPDAVIKYFARYTRRIAISDPRLVAYDGKAVTFNYRDRRDRNRVKSKGLEAPTFAQRLLSHVLPPRFIRIRRFGILSNRARKPMLKKAREGIPPAARSVPTVSSWSLRAGVSPGCRSTSSSPTS